MNSTCTALLVCCVLAAALAFAGENKSQVNKAELSTMDYLVGHAITKARDTQRLAQCIKAYAPTNCPSHITLALVNDLELAHFAVSGDVSPQMQARLTRTAIQSYNLLQDDYFRSGVPKPERLIPDIDWSSPEKLRNSLKNAKASNNDLQLTK